ncbi:MAG: replication initiator protein A [Fusobacteriaceae bacterium]
MRRKIEELWEEVEDHEAVETLEENLSIENLEIQNPNLVRVDMNMIEYPLFSKNNHRKKNQAVKYHFNNNKNMYIKIEPVVGDYIPGDFEEKVFIGLLKSMKKKGFVQSFYITSSEILAELGLENKIYYKKVKQAILRLSKTSYEFKNTLYANKINSTVEETISTKMLDIRIIQLAKDKKIKEYYNDNRIKEVYEINISKHFYENIIRKGYMVYDANILLEIESSVSRTIYMLINKLRFTKLYLKLPVIYLIKRIPLKYDDKNLGRTVKVLENSCKELLRNKLLENYVVIKKGSWKDAEIEFYFSEEHNQIKQLQFFDDKNHFNNILENLPKDDFIISYTEEESLSMLNQVKLEVVKIEPTIEDVEKIINILPKKAKELKTLPKFIKVSIQQYGIEYINLVAEYIKEQKPKSVLGYFAKALQNGWADEYILNKKLKFSKENIKKEEIKKEVSQEKSEADEELKITKEKYLAISDSDKKKLETEGYKDYVEKCGGKESSSIKTAFKLGKNFIMAKYLLEKKYFETSQQILTTFKEEVKIEKKIKEEKETKPLKKVQEKTMNKIEIIDVAKNIFKIEKEYTDFVEFKFDAFEQLENKLSYSLLKTIMNFLTMEEYYRGQKEGYKLEFKFVSQGKSLIYVEKLD